MSGDLSSGKILLGRYRLDRRLDEGGMSVVWAATHVMTGKAVALKLLKADAARDEPTRRRMLREARAACAVVHPNVVAIHDVLELPDGSPVLVMDLLQGEPLRERLVRRKALSIEETATLLVPVVSALGTAHSVGVIHRDLKPDNIFLANQAGEVRVLVLDFGIAKVVATGNSNASQVNALTNTGTMLGTPFYMAPEQILGEAMDHRADIWSIGVILYECLAGERPTEAENVGKILKRVLTHDIVPLASKAPSLPEEVISLVDRMLAQSPKDRPQSLREVGEILARYATGVSLGAFGPPTTVAEPDSTEPSSAAPASGSRAGTASPTDKPSNRASEYAETLVAQRPPELQTRKAPAITQETATLAAPAPREPASWTPRVLLALTLAAAGVAGALFFAKGKDRSPYVPASASLVAPANSVCPAGMALVPGGTFRMGSDDGKDDERPIHDVTVSTFCMDVSEVTSGDYSDCMRRGACRLAESTVLWANISPEIRDRDSTLCSAYQADRPTAPINCISWNDADAYCRVLEKRLPAEEEWEYAAGGGAEHRRFPWGSALPTQRLLNACDRSCAAATEKRGGGKQTALFDTDDGYSTLAPVGSFPEGASKFGVQDMAGNVWEWTSSPYCVYPEHTCQSSHRVFRGGGWGLLLAPNARVAARMWSSPGHRYDDVGFRCVKDVN